MLHAKEFFSIKTFEHNALFEDHKYVWDTLKHLKKYINVFINRVSEHRKLQNVSILPGAALIGNGNIVIAEGAVVEAGACIIGPAVIGKNSVVRHGAYIREYTLIGENCVVGHASEIKHSIMLDGSQAPHFAYVGDSILGNNTNLGAGTKLSNISMLSLMNASQDNKTNVKVTIDGVEYDTGLIKLGAILGDGVQIGCNSVTNPGCLISKNTLIYPNMTVPKGFYPRDSIIKPDKSLKIIKKRIG